MTYGNYPPHKKIQKVLIIKLRHLGDVLLTTPVFSAIKKALPLSEIDVYINQEASPILENNLHIHSIISYDRKWKKKNFLFRVFYEIKILRRLRRKKYDLVINLTEGDRGAVVAKFTKAPYRVGLEDGSKRKQKIYTHLVKRCHSPRHTVEKNLDALRVIGIFPTPQERRLQFFLPPFSEKSIVHQVFSKFSNEYFLIHPTSRWKFKCWPKEKMRRLIEELLAKNYKIVLTSGDNPQEIKMIEEIVQKLKSPSLMNLAGKTSILEMAQLIKSCKAMVCVDSFPFHIASTYKKPVVALFGPTSDITWGSWQNPYAKILTHEISCRPCFLDGCGGSKMSDCLHRIEVSRVLNALETLCGDPMEQMQIF